MKQLFRKFITISIVAMLMLSVGLLGACDNATGSSKSGELLTLNTAYNRGYLNRNDIMNIAYIANAGVVYEMQNWVETAIDFQMTDEISMELNNATKMSIKQAWRNKYYEAENHTDLNSISIQFFGWHGGNAVVLISDSIPFFTPEAGRDIVSNIVFELSHESNPFRVWRPANK